MLIQTIEFRFPDGGFEVDATRQVVKRGDVVTKQGRVWKVDEILSGIPPIVMLQPARRRGTETSN
jgi:hypothetical protein